MSPEFNDIIIESGWIELEVVIREKKTMTLKLRLTHLSGGLPMESLDDRRLPPTWGEMIAFKCIEIVSDWDFTDKGSPVPVSTENKRRVFEKIIGCPVKRYRFDGADKWITPEKSGLLGIVLVDIATDEANFLKN